MKFSLNILLLASALGVMAAPKHPKTATTTTSSPLPGKTGVADCNVEGSAGVPLSSKIFGYHTLADAVTCQAYCRGTTACISYSFNYTAAVNNCVKYNEWSNIPGAVLPGKTNTFFSDKYPEDGSDFCYA